MFEYLANGNLRKEASTLYPEHRAVCQAYKDKLRLIEYCHKLDGSYFCEYDTAGLVPLTKFYSFGKKAKAKDIVKLMHGVLMTLIFGKKIGLFENSFVLQPQYVFVRENSAKPELIYLPMDVSLKQADEYAGLLGFLEETCDYSDVLGGDIVSALNQAGFDMNEAASIIAEAANKNRVEKTCLHEKEAYLYLLEGDTRHEIKITSDNFILGRKRNVASFCFVGEKYKGISRIHAAIKFNGTSYCIEDKDSSGGTFVNEKRVPSGRPVPLVNGDEIKLYTTRLLFEINHHLQNS